MKKTALALALALPMLAGTTSAQAAGHPDVGCGAGTILWEGKLDSWGVKVLAATTNGTSGNQTFGITSGTLGCSTAGALFGDARLVDYTVVSLDQLSQDIATGRGENLNTFGALYGISAEDMATFAQTLQANYASIFTGENVTAQEVLTNINTVVAASSKLSGYAYTA